MQSGQPIPTLKVLGCGLLLAVLTFAVYANSFTAPLVLDDVSNIRNNAAIRQLWPPEPAQVPGLRGRPVVNATFALNYAAGGLNVEGYHAINLAIHLASGLVLLGVIHRTLRLPALRERWGDAALFIAAGASALWLLHPLQTEAVTYLSQRTESLMALCYLLTLYFFIRGVAVEKNRRAWFALAVLACLAGMGSKEVMVTVPVVVLLYDRAFIAGSFRDAWRTRRGFYVALAACWIALPILMSDFRSRGLGGDLGISSWRYLLLESRVIAHYFGLTLWPAKLVFDYGTAAEETFAQVWPYALAMAGVLAGVTWAVVCRPALGFLLAWPFLLLAPSSSVVPVAQQPMAEHRMYLPLASLTALLALGAVRLPRAAASVLLATAAVALGLTTFHRNEIYRDEVRLWQDTAAKRPDNTRAHQNLGNAYMHAGRLPEAESAYQRAVALTPLNPDGLNNLGVLYARTGRTAEAMSSFQRAREIAPDDAESYYNLGCVFLETKRTAEAEKEFAEAIRRNPRHAGSHNNLAILLVAQGKFSDALEHYTLALQVNPADVEVYANRAYAYLQQGRLGAAINDYEQAVAIDPGFEAARKNLEKLRQLAKPRSAP